jgi:hypothetical protein
VIRPANRVLNRHYCQAKLQKRSIIGQAWSVVSAEKKFLRGR